MLDLAMQTAEANQQLDSLQGKVLVLGDRVEGMLIQAADRVTSICEWMLYASRGEDHATSNV